MALLIAHTARSEAEATRGELWRQGQHAEQRAQAIAPMKPAELDNPMAGQLKTICHNDNKPHCARPGPPRCRAR
jgi:hypothetical protein